MKNKKNKFDEKYKKELSKKLYQMAENNELIFRKMLEESGTDTSKIKIVDRSKFMVKYIPDVMEELFEKYGTSKVLMDDDKIKKEGLELVQKRFHADLAKQTVKSWNIYYILLHCKIYETINIDENVMLIPFDGLPCNDYLEIIDRLSHRLGPPTSHLSEKIFENGKEYIREKYSKKNPISLLVFQDVKADTENEVYGKTKDYAENVILCMSNLTNSSIEFRGYVIEGKIEGFKEIYPLIYFPHYKPTYMEPEGLEKVAKRILQNIDKKHMLKLALKYEKEALSEEDEKFRILKRWSALEFIAEECPRTNSLNEKLLSKNDIKKITKNIKNILTNKGNFDKNSKIEDKIKTCVGQINHKNAKEKVRDLLEYVGYPIKKIDNVEKDIIDVIYQHRNCITHIGGCYKSDKNIKGTCKGPRYCRESELGQKELNGELSRMLTQVIGRFIGVEFEFEPEIPEHIKRRYTDSLD